MDNKEQTQFRGAMRSLLFSYPRSRFSEDNFSRFATAWWFKLKHHELSDVLAALEKAPEVFPKSLPSVGEVMAMIAERTRAETGIEEARQAAFLREKREAEAARRQIPTIPQKQAAYVREAEEEAEQIARLWEVEDAIRNQPPFRDTPLEIGAKRMAMICKLLDRMDTVSTRPADG